ncbi:MAG: T9SS type A sorting domain-containing protein [Bacteroidales bacterium]|nr:T9SS type A sorting domain-containing protein [Bacteroidales bacterium]
MDGGLNLTSRLTLPAADSLELSMELIATSNISVQSTVMISNAHDANGVLLYPDGEPRFRLIYTNGGKASSHGESLGETGRQIIRTYYENGGSYTGSCAGAFISSLGTDPAGSDKVTYYHIWPGYACPTGQQDIRTGHFIPQGSPLLNYYDFGGDNYVSDVYHNGGAYAYEPNMPSGTEILARYDYPASGQMNNRASVWAYRNEDKPETGRIVVTGSHPEAITTGERLDLMASILQYAYDGAGMNHVKAALSNGEIRIMDKSTGDKDPAYTKIGDRQYHHFSVELPEGSSTLTLSVTGDDNYDLSLYVNSNDFAFNSNAIYKDRSAGANKSMTLENLSGGIYYVSVECETTVTAIRRTEHYEYTNNLDVLNGVAYTIRADWSATTDIDKTATDNLSIYPNPFTTHITLQSEDGISVEEIAIFDLRGNTVYRQKFAGHSSAITIEPGNSLQPGTYYLRIRSRDKVFVKKIIKAAY